MQYSITDLERLSGIKAGTIRIWEKRYSLLNPSRDCNNVRCYSENDLQHLILIGKLTQCGSHKISSLSSLSINELEDKVSDAALTSCSCKGLIDGLTMLIEKYDETNFVHALNNRLEHMTMERVQSEVLIPLKERIGMMILMDSLNKTHMTFLDKVVDEYLAYKVQCKLSKVNQCRGSAVIVQAGCSKSQAVSLLLKYHLIEQYISVKFFQANDFIDVDFLETMHQLKPHMIFINCHVPANGAYIDLSHLNVHDNLDIPIAICGPGSNKMYNLQSSVKGQSLQDNEITPFVDQVLSKKVQLV